MEKVKTKGVSGLGVGVRVGGRRAVSDTISQRSTSLRPHSHLDGDDEDDEDGDETQHGFEQPSRKRSSHLRVDSTVSLIFRVLPSNMSLLMPSSLNSDRRRSVGRSPIYHQR